MGLLYSNSFVSDINISMARNEQMNDSGRAREPEKKRKEPELQIQYH